MNPITHFSVGWLVANTSDTLNQRERAAITLAGVAPDIDGLGIVAEVLTRNSENPLLWYSNYHHLLGHNLCFSLLLAGVGFMIATKRWLTAWLVLLSFHLHILGDLVGSRGPDGYQWPIYYLYPLTKDWQLTWQGQWELVSWQNILITLAALLWVFILARKRGCSPLKMFSAKADKVFVRALRQRFPTSDAQS